MQRKPETEVMVADHPSKSPSETRATTPRCEIIYDFDPKDHSPTYANLLKERIAIGRRQELEKAARSEEPPNDEELMECCGSRCKPCVKELFHEKVDVWSECEAIRDQIAASQSCNSKLPSNTLWKDAVTSRLELEGTIYGTTAGRQGIIVAPIFALDTIRDCL